MLNFCLVILIEMELPNMFTNKQLFWKIIFDEKSVKQVQNVNLCTQTQTLCLKRVPI